MLILNIPTTLREANAPDIAELGDRYNALIGRAVGSFVTDVKENQGFIPFRFPGGRSNETLLVYGRNYEGEFKLGYLPTVERVDPYLQGFRR